LNKWLDVGDGYNKTPWQASKGISFSFAETTALSFQKSHGGISPYLKREDT